MTYRRRASPLHAARAAAGGAWCAAVACAVLAAQHPLVLAVLALVIVGGAAGARVARDAGRIMVWMVPWALVIALVNMVVVRDGLTVFARLGEVPPFGQVDLTLEALVYGCLFGLRLLLVAAAFAIFTVAVDPDDLLRLLRRASLRSALAAALATRLVPVLAADARRIADARRCRADGGGEGAAGHVAVLRAVATGALDRALDVAATLEVRGYATAAQASRRRGWWRTRERGGRPWSHGRGAPRWAGRGGGRPWSRHDVAFSASAIALVGLTVAARVGGLGGFDPYPLLESGDVAGAAALAGGLAVVALAPFAARRGIAG